MDKPKPPIAITILSWLSAIVIIGYATILLLGIVLLNELWFGAEIRSSFSPRMLLGYLGYIIIFICAVSFIKLKKHRLYFFIVSIFLAIGLYLNLTYFTTDLTPRFLIRRTIFWLPQIVVFLYFFRNFKKFYSKNDLGGKPERKPIVYSQ